MRYLEGKIGRRFDLDRQYYRWDSPFPREHELEAVALGRVPAISWSALRRDLTTRVQWGAIASGAEDAWIRERAAAVKALDWPIMMTFHLEPEDDPGYGTATAYRAAWRRIVTIFRQEGATNVVWVWNMMAFTFTRASGRDPALWYPGDDVIDWLAADGYNWFGSPYIPGQPWRTFDSIFRPFYTWGTTHHPGKPLAVYEFGSLEDTITPDPLRKATWLTQAAATVKSWPQLKAIVYYNAHGWWFDSSLASTAAYKTIANDTYFKQLRSAFVVRGTPGSDRFVGTAASEVFYGGGGNDVVIMGGGNDIVYGGDGSDQIYGGDGSDRLYGDAGNDVVYAGLGNDPVVSGGAGADRLLGEAGADILNGGGGGDSMLGGDGRDTLYARDFVRDVVNGGLSTDSARVDRRLDSSRSIERFF